MKIKFIATLLATVSLPAISSASSNLNDYVSTSYQEMEAVYEQHAALELSTAMPSQVATAAYAISLTQNGSRFDDGKIEMRLEHSAPLIFVDP